jgi:hypothetical protein
LAIAFYGGPVTVMVFPKIAKKPDFKALVAANKSGMGMIGVVDNGCEITDFESKWSDNISMLAIVVNNCI